MGFKTPLRWLLWRAARIALLRDVLIHGYEAFNRRGGGWQHQHPYDRRHGVHTSGSIPGYLLETSVAPSGSFVTHYVAAQPSVIRTALAAIPEPQTCELLDLGCGKGRVLLVASEFGFRSITGVELSPTLARRASRNVRLFARAHPAADHIAITIGDAVAHPLPSQDMVVFLYNPFGRALIEQLCTKLTQRLQDSQRAVYVVYYNPVWAALLDALPLLERRYARQIPYARREIGYGPDQSDAVVIWQNRGNPHPLPPGDATAPVTIKQVGVRAEIA
jgi:SAM-dependent methyltransferase